MKKTLLLVAVALGLMASSCATSKSWSGTSSSTSTSSTSSSESSSSSSQSLLGSLLSGLVGNSTTVTVKNLTGTWKYSSPECRFTSESALAQAGGAVAANTIESKLANIYTSLGINANTTSFTFNDDNTCSMVLGGKTINGTYTLDSDTRELNIKSNTGLIKLNGKVYYSYSTLSLLFEADKLLSIAKMLSAFTGQGSSTMSTISSLLDNYDGMMIGMNLQK